MAHGTTDEATKLRVQCVRFVVYRDWKKLMYGERQIHGVQINPEPLPRAAHGGIMYL